jgi:hypothetical protein
MHCLGDKIKKNEMNRACDTNLELEWSRLRLRLRFVTFFVGALLLNFNKMVECESLIVVFQQLKTPSTLYIQYVQLA